MQNCRLGDLDPGFHAGASVMSKCRRAVRGNGASAGFRGGKITEAPRSASTPSFAGGPKGRGRGAFSEVRGPRGDARPFQKMSPSMLDKH